MHKYSRSQEGLVEFYVTHCKTSLERKYGLILLREVITPVEAHIKMSSYKVTDPVPCHVDHNFDADRL